MQYCNLYIIIYIVLTGQILVFYPSFLYEMCIHMQTLGSCDRASWAKCEERDKTNKMQQLDVYY